MSDNNNELPSLGDALAAASASVFAGLSIVDDADIEDTLRGATVLPTPPATTIVSGGQSVTSSITNHPIANTITFAEQPCFFKFITFEWWFDGVQ